MESQSLINWYPDLLEILAVDLVLAILLIAAYRIISGLISNVSSTEELSVRDNVAFGLVFAGGVFALAIVMSGAVSGEAGKSLLKEIILVLSYGLVGIVMMILSRKVFDIITLPEIRVQDLILKGNQAVAIVDVGNLLATAIIIRAAMVWIQGTAFTGLLAVVIGFIVSQAVIVLVTKYRTKVYASRHNGSSLQAALEAGNKALAMRYAGHKVGVALAVTAASGFVPYNDDRLILACLLWGFMSLVLSVVLSLLAIFARQIILAKINVVEEVDEQQNLGIGFVEAMIYVSVGFILSSLIA